MIVGNELEAWVHDRDRQRETQRTIGTFGASWRARPIHQHFAATMAALRNPSGDDVAAAMARLFANDAWVDVLVAELADAMRDDPFFLPSFQALTSGIHTGLLVYEDAHVMVTAGVCQAVKLADHKSGKGGTGSINFTGQINVLKFVKAGAARLSFFEAPMIGDDFATARAGSCRPAGIRSVADGEIFVVDGRCQSYVIDHAAANLFVIQAIVKTGQAPLAVEYDAATGACLGCSATDDSDSRIQMIATLVRKLGHKEGFAAIAAFLDHPRFFVRWHAMRELLGIDAAAALPHLRRLASADPHPDVRAAAVNTLRHVEGVCRGEAA